MDFAIWFCISLLLVFIILSDIGCLKLILLDQNFDLHLAATFACVLVKKTNSNTENINLSQANKPKWINSSPSNNAI